MVDAVAVPKRHAVSVILDQAGVHEAFLDCSGVVRVEPDEQELRLIRNRALKRSIPKEGIQRRTWMLLVHDLVSWMMAGRPEKKLADLDWLILATSSR